MCTISTKIPTMLNPSDTLSNIRIVAMFVIVNIQKNISHRICTYA
jgi:hypothetical protein